MSVSKISETRAIVIEKVLNALGKNQHIDVYRADDWENGDIDKDGDVILKFDIIWGCWGSVPASEAASFAFAMSTIADTAMDIASMKLGVVDGKDQFIDTSYKKMEQFDYLYHAIQCSPSRGKELLKSFAAGEFYIENGRIVD